MSEMVDRVAVAIGKMEPDWSVGIKWAMNAQNRERLRAVARAAIEVMREPTEAMIAAGRGPITDRGGGWYDSNDCAKCVWKSMTDEAVK